MTLHDVWRVYRGWRRRPPSHHLVAGYLGIKDSGPEAPPDRIASEADLDAMIAEAKNSIPGRA